MSKIGKYKKTEIIQSKNEKNILKNKKNPEHLTCIPG